MRTRQRLTRTARAVRSAVTHPPWVTPGHFYSPISSAADVERALHWPADFPGIQLREKRQLALAAELISLFDGVPERRYRAGNGMYDLGDASIYQAILRHATPARVVEVGSGFSTAKLLDTADEFLPHLTVTCIEPHPARLLGLLLPGDAIDLVDAPVQDVPIEVFTALESGDVLFIDSTHVVKAGSDVVWLFSRVLPRLASGVLVHIHDIAWPFEYPAAWLREGRNWNEAYLLQAFLCHNDAWRIEFFSSWVWHEHLDLVPGGLLAEQPGSIWLRRR